MEGELMPMEDFSELGIITSEETLDEFLILESSTDECSPCDDCPAEVLLIKTTTQSILPQMAKDLRRNINA